MSRLTAAERHEGATMQTMAQTATLVAYEETP